MGIIGDQIINMMINRIKQNNPKIALYIDEMQNGANSQEVLKKAINNGDITRQQWNNAKPLLQKYGKQVGINISNDDVQNMNNFVEIACSFPNSWEEKFLWETAH